jgi:hypothetical protein
MCVVRYYRDKAGDHRLEELGCDLDEDGSIDWDRVLNKCREEDGGKGIYERIDVVSGKAPNSDGIPHVLLSVVCTYMRVRPCMSQALLFCSRTTRFPCFCPPTSLPSMLPTLLGAGAKMLGDL